MSDCEVTKIDESEYTFCLFSNCDPVGFEDTVG